HRSGDRTPLLHAALPISGSQEPRRGLRPTVAARNQWARIEALRRNRAFLQAYLEARGRFAAGIRDVVFPAGTYWLARFAGVACCEPPRLRLNSRSRTVPS